MTRPVREFAILDVAPEVLAQVMVLLPQSLKVVGSGESGWAPVVRLYLDVTATDQPGGEWQCIVTDTPTGRTAVFGPRKA